MTPMTTAPLIADPICRVCRSPLDRQEFGRLHRYFHTATWQREHPDDAHAPVPVPAAEFERIEGYCDFCSNAHPTVVFAWKEKITLAAVAPAGTQIVPMVEDASPEWAACDGCAKQIRAKNVLGLVARVRRVWQRKGLASLFKHSEGTPTALYQALLRRPFVEAPLTAEDPRGTKGLILAWAQWEIAQGQP